MLEPAVEIAKTATPASSRPDASIATLQIVAYALAIAMSAAYVGWLVTLHSYPFQDFPNHLARGVALADLMFHHGARFGSVFSLSWVPVPYLLHDLVLATLIEMFGPQFGGALFVTGVLLSLPLAMMFYMRAARLAPQARPVVILITLYLSTDCFFLLAFMGFRLALAFVILSLGFAEWLRRRWSGAVFALYVVTLVCGYFTHLTATVFFAPVLGISSAARVFFRQTSIRREVYLWVPLVVLMLLHVAVLSPAHSASNPATFDYIWGTWHNKLRYLTFEYMRYGSHLEEPMMLLLFACLVWPLRRYLQLRRLTQPAVLAPLATAAFFLAAYFVMPKLYSDASFVDVRALPMVVLMLMLMALNVPGPRNSGGSFATAAVVGMAFALCATNLAFLMRHTGKSARQLDQYRQLADTIPSGSLVLPIHTLDKEAELRPFLHASGYAVADRAAITPYLFAGDRGEPMKYFRYRDRPYWPEERWYRARLSWDRAIEKTYVIGGRTYTWRLVPGKALRQWKTADLVPVDWNRVACTYDYLIATLPLDEKLIEVPVRRVSQNRVAALYAVDRTACRPELLSGSAEVSAIGQN